MDSCNRFLMFLVQFITGIAFLLAAASQASALRCTALSGDDRYSILNTVQAMHQVRSQRQGPLITVFEIGDGDPALNGSFLYIRIKYNGLAFFWKTGLNVHSIQKLSAPPENTLNIRAKEDFFDSNNKVKSREVIYKISFYLNNDTLGDTISIENRTVKSEISKKNNRYTPQSIATHKEQVCPTKDDNAARLMKKRTPRST